jgi:coproporphyrinogen III oxidase
MDFNFVKDVGKTFLETYSKIINERVDQKFNDEEKNIQLVKRGRYVEFNLLYDRGTIFGLNTGGNPEAILMSLPPNVKWE